MPRCEVQVRVTVEYIFSATFHISMGFKLAHVQLELELELSNPGEARSFRTFDSCAIATLTLYIPYIPLCINLNAMI